MKWLGAAGAMRRQVPMAAMLWLAGAVLYLPFYLIRFNTFSPGEKALGMALSATYFMGAWQIGYCVARSFPVGVKVTVLHLASAALAASALVPMTRLLLYMVYTRVGMLPPDETFLDVLREDYTPYLVTYYITIVAAAHALYYYEFTAYESEKAAVLAAELTRARARALEAQLQPHFLFNALNSISAYVRDQPARASFAAEQLKQLVSAVTAPRASPLCTLSDEIDFIKSYLQLEQLRYGERLRVQLDLAPDTLGVAVPRFLLQPIVENAVRHGVATQEAPASVTIASRLEDRMIVIDVENDGAPLRLPITQGIGLANTRRRLSRLFRGRARFTVTPGSHGGCRATIRLPREATVA